MAVHVHVTNLQLIIIIIVNIMRVSCAVFPLASKKEDVCPIHPGLENWTYPIANADHIDTFRRFWTYFTGVKSSMWALTKTDRVVISGYVVIANSQSFSFCYTIHTFLTKTTKITVIITDLVLFLSNYKV